jgi:hypothetical protein
MILEAIAVLNGFLLGALLIALAVFETKCLPSDNFLVLPSLIIGATCGALLNTYIDPHYLVYITLAETLANIGLATWAVREDRNQKK